MIGKILCWLGLHQPVITHPAEDLSDSAYGFCARCNKSYQWDAP